MTETADRHDFNHGFSGMFLLDKNSKNPIGLGD